MTAGRPVVLHVLEALEGGTSRHLSDVVTWAGGVEHHVAVPSERRGWVTDRAAVPAMRDAGATIHLVEMRRTPVHPNNALALATLVRIARRERVDIVHAHSSVGGVLGRLAGTVARARRVYTPNGLARGTGALVIERGLGRLTDVFVAVSDSEAVAAVDGRLARSDRVVIVRNGIELGASQPAAAPDLRERLGLPADEVLVGAIARLVDQKQPLVLVEAAAGITAARRGVTFLLVGSGPMQRDVDVASRPLGARFRRLGLVERARDALSQFDVLISASAFEGAPYAPLEAMDAGVPVVLTDVVGNRDAVVDGVTGLLVPPGDAAALAGATLRLLDDATLRARLVDAARSRLRADFDVRSMGAALSELYRGLLSR